MTNLYPYINHKGDKMPTYIDNENRFNKINYVQWFADYCEKRNLDFDFAEKMGELGYDMPEKGIILTNWNNVPEHIANGLERRGFATEWSDEWIVAHNQNEMTSEAYRTQPDSYTWTPSYTVHEGEILGLREAQANPEAYIELLLNDSDRACTFDINLSDQGFVQYEPGDEQEYQNGLHPGMNDSPSEILEKAQEKYPGHDFVFEISEQSQLYIGFILWMRPDDYEPK